TQEMRRTAQVAALQARSCSPHRVSSGIYYCYWARQQRRSVGTSSSLRDLGNIHPDSTFFAICDVQEKFRPVIPNMPQLIHTCSTLINAAPLFNIPLLLTEQ